MTDAERAAGFDVHVAVAADDVTLRVRGELDMATTPVLGALLDAVIERGHRRVVLDLGGVGFLGAAGLGVIVGAATHLAPSSNGAAALVVRSPSPMVTWLLDCFGLGALVTVEQPAVALAVAPVVDGHGDASIGRAEELTALAALPANCDVVDAALRLIVAVTKATVGGADGASVTVPRHGRFTTAAASDERVAGMDRDQYDTGEGPCLSAATEGRTFQVDHLDHETRWPMFAARSSKRGIRSVLSTPLLTGDLPIGALNIYSCTPGTFTGPEQAQAVILAAAASGILAGAGDGVSAQQLGERVQDALRRRGCIAKAQGVLMERDGITADAAFGVLLNSSRQTNRPLREHAATVLASVRTAADRPAPWIG